MTLDELDFLISANTQIDRFVSYAKFDYTPFKCTHILEHKINDLEKYKLPQNLNSFLILMLPSESHRIDWYSFKKNRCGN